MGAAAVDVQLVELAEDWLRSRRVRRARADGVIRPATTDRARRMDLCRWGRLLAMTNRRRVELAAPFDLSADLAHVTLADFTVDKLEVALLAAGSEPVSASGTVLATATVRRMLSTLRGFCAWLHQRGHLDFDPCAGDTFSLGSAPQSEPHAISADDYAVMVAVADGAKPARARALWWPSRNVALLELLGRCGLRASEACAATVGWIDERPERPVLRVVGKGGRSRTVPMPASTMRALGVHLDERGGRDTLHASAPLLAATSGGPMSYQMLDRTVRMLAGHAGVRLPEQAAAHALRHWYGNELALRGVHMSQIAELLGHVDVRTTQVYTRVASAHLIAVLDEAGML